MAPDHERETLSDPNTLPTDEVIKKAAQFNVYDSDGNQIPFGNLLEGHKTVVVFIRCVILMSSFLSNIDGIFPNETFGRTDVMLGHFFCGVSVLAMRAD